MQNRRSPIKPLFFLITLISLLILSSSSAFAKAKTEIGPITNVQETPNAYIVVDAKSGSIISSKNIHDPLNVASTSKILTALAAVNTISPDQLIDIPTEAENVQPMRIGMKAGQKWKRDDLLYSLLLVSANDAAYALANASAGSISKFSDQQKRIAKELFMKDSTFGDPSGLDDNFALNGATKMSAYDLAIASRAVLAQPDLAKIVSTLNYQFVGGDNAMHTLTNHNDQFLNGYEGANGLKTGYTQKAGRTLVVSATRNGTTLIGVILGVQQTNEWAKSLLDSGFSKIQSGKLPSNTPKLPAIGVINSRSNLTILNIPKSFNSTESQTSAKQAASDKESSASFISVPIISILILAIVTGLFFWRRHIIKQRKKRRRQRALAAREAGRRKMIDVIDLTQEDQSELVSKT
ncbi:MAG: hypothetical protein U0R17_02520 [Acidimicrobiia bacterium]